MRSLYLRIYITVVVVLALFALASGALLQRHLSDQRERAEAAVRERVGAWAELLQRSLPPAEAPAAEQAQALREWSLRLRLPMALDDANGQRIATSDSYARREADMNPGFLERVQVIRLEDGRALRVPRPRAMRPGGDARRGGPGMEPGMGGPPGMGPGYGQGMGQGMSPGMGPGLRGGGLPPPDDPSRLWPWPHLLPDGVGLAALLVVLFVAVAAGAYPVVRRLTRRLEALKQGVETFGAGALHHRVNEEGRDEVAAVATSFNRAAARVEALVRSHQNLLANASHELRSPLTRLKMALAMLRDTPADGHAALEREIDADIAELDALVEEVLLSSRLDAQATQVDVEPVDLLGLAAEEAARVGASVEGEPASVMGEERLLRRALRNLLENAQRYGVQDVQAQVHALPGGGAEIHVCDRGPGVPDEYRERIFEAFFRLPGHAERAGGVGLGLALVRQIATRHGGQVRCEAREGRGSCFVLSLPAGLPGAVQPGLPPGAAPSPSAAAGPAPAR